MFNLQQFLRAEFGGAAHLVYLMNAYSMAPASRAAIAKWFQRGSVSGARLAELLCIREMETGSAVKMTTYWSCDNA